MFFAKNSEEITGENERGSDDLVHKCVCVRVYFLGGEKLVKTGGGGRR